MESKKTIRKRRKPASVEVIYQSITGNEKKITTTQKINELLCQYRGEFLGITCGEGFFKDPSLAAFYQSQWGDVSNAVRRYGGRNVISAIENNKWCCSPQYGDRPLLIKKIQAIMREMAVKQDTIPENNKSVGLPHNHVKETKKRKRDF